MTAYYNHPEMSYIPSVEELRTQLDKFNRNILESAKKFGRWWDGFCKIFEETTDKETSEKTIRYTFFDDATHNPVITQLNLEIVTLTNQIQKKFEYYSDRFNDRTVKTMYDKNEMTKMQKLIEKNQSVTDIEKKIIGFRQFKQSIKKQKQDFIQNALINVDYTGVKAGSLEKAEEWLAILGRVLTEISKKELA